MSQSQGDAMSDVRGSQWRYSVTAAVPIARVVVSLLQSWVGSLDPPRRCGQRCDQNRSSFFYFSMGEIAE
jgi:hypothetical protein